MKLKTGDYSYYQDLWIKNNSIKIGTPVRVMRIAESGELGWFELWVNGMDKQVNKVLKVVRFSVGISNKGKNKRQLKNYNYGIQLSDGFNYPYFVLYPETDCFIPRNRLDNNSKTRS